MSLGAALRVSSLVPLPALSPCFKVAAEDVISPSQLQCLSAAMSPPPLRTSSGSINRDKPFAELLSVSVLSRQKSNTGKGVGFLYFVLL